MEIGKSFFGEKRMKSRPMSKIEPLKFSLFILLEKYKSFKTVIFPRAHNEYK
jgi:hypothetical protein